MSAVSAEPSIPKDEVSQLAYDSYLREGCLSGRAFEHWTTAEWILRLGREPQSPLSTSYRDGELWVHINAASMSKLDEESLQKVDQALARIIDVLPQPRVVIDLSHMRYLCSTMLGMLAFLCRRAKNKGGRLAVAHAPECLRGEMHLWGLDRVMEVGK